MKKITVENLVKTGLELFGDKMDCKICPLILYQPKRAKKNETGLEDVNKKEQ